MVYFDKENGRLFYDSVEITDTIENRLSKNEITGQYETIKAFHWIATNTGYIGYKDDKIFYVYVDVQRKVANNELHITVQPKEPIQIGIVMNTYDLYISQVYR